MILFFLYGENYVPAAQVLKILSLRSMTAVFAGAASTVLISIGRSRVIMWTALVGATLNIVLNYTLIPVMGYEGAALATLIAVFVNLSLNFTYLLRKYGIHPFTPKYLRPAVLATLIAIAVYAVTKSLPLYLWMLPVYLMVFVMGYMASIVFSKSIESEDIYIYKAITRRMGIDIKIINRLLDKLS